MNKLQVSELELWKSSKDRYIAIRQALLMIHARIIEPPMFNFFSSESPALNNIVEYSDHKIPECLMCKIHWDSIDYDCGECPWQVEFGECNNPISTWYKLQGGPLLYQLATIDDIILPTISAKIKELGAKKENG